MSFLDDSYLLTSEPARELYREIAHLPIIDPHNHADVREIVANEHYTDIWQVEGATDHYVWELMRRRGIPEDQVTGQADNLEKWCAMADKFPQFIGNPTYEWIHLDLRRCFNLDVNISGSTALQIWNLTREALQTESFRPQALLKTMRVEIMCTTDDPTMRLVDHETARLRVACTKIYPTWRPDKAMNLEKAAWKPFLVRLGDETGSDTSSLSGLLEALRKTHRYFQSMGCVASDHGLSEPASHFVPAERAAALHARAWAGESLSAGEIRDYKAFMLHQFGLMNAEGNWTMQLHIGAVRDYRDLLFNRLGADTGGDLSSQSIELVANLRRFLNEFDEQLSIVLYCVDPTHMPTLATLARAFPNVTLGAPWWWNDSPYGMETQLKYLATVDLLANHAGMVTDSRKLMSFGSRTEMFRRILCEVLGEMIVKGQTPEEPALDLAKALSYSRPHQLFFGE